MKLQNNRCIENKGNIITKKTLLAGEKGTFFCDGVDWYTDKAKKGFGIVERHCR
jgi:hypothetical protein